MSIKWLCNYCGMQGKINSPFTIHQALPTITTEHKQRQDEMKERCCIANLGAQNVFLMFALGSDNCITADGRLTASAGTTWPSLWLFGIP